MKQDHPLDGWLWLALTLAALAYLIMACCPPRPVGMRCYWHVDSEGHNYLACAYQPEDQADAPSR